jgi:hypothetical protein
VTEHLIWTAVCLILAASTVLMVAGAVRTERRHRRHWQERRQSLAAMEAHWRSVMRAVDGDPPPERDDCVVIPFTRNPQQGGSQQ